MRRLVFLWWHLLGDVEVLHPIPAVPRATDRLGRERGGVFAPGLHRPGASVAGDPLTLAVQLVDRGLGLALPT